MTAVVKMSMEAGDTVPPIFTVKENAKIESVGEGEHKPKDESCPMDKDCGCETDGAVLGTQEVKIDIEATSILEKNGYDKEKAKMEEDESPSKETATCTKVEDFSEEKDVPEMSHRVYDFNMVKQKTLPRISFGNNGFLKAFSSHSKTYIIMWTLMPISLTICIIILVLYWIG